MKHLIFATVVLACACSSPGAPAGLHTHAAAGGPRTQITQIFAPHATMADAVAAAVTAQSLRAVESESGEAWGRVAAVDAQGIQYRLTWELATAQSDGEECVLLFISCEPADGAARIGELAQAVRKAAEGSI